MAASDAAGGYAAAGARRGQGSSRHGPRFNAATWTEKEEQWLTRIAAAQEKLKSARAEDGREIERLCSHEETI